MSVELKVFVSSKMIELHDERQAIENLLAKRNAESGWLKVIPWVYEKDAPAANDSVQSVYRDEVKHSDLYIGIFWNEYSIWTIDEFDWAGQNRIPRHVYWKRAEHEKCDSRLETFFAQHTDPQTGIAVKWFENLTEFRESVEQSLDHWISVLLRQKAIFEAILATKPDHIPRRPEHFVGREPLLSEIYTSINKNQRVLLHGLGGIGKTALAAEFAARYLEKTPDKSVIWFDAGRHSASEILAALAQVFNHGVRILEKPDKEKIIAVRELLAESHVGLIVLDDIHDGQALGKVLEAIPPSVGLLVTSLQRHAFFSHITEVPALTPKSAPGAALEALKLYAGRSWKSDDEDANELCKLLGYFPFALRIAGYKMREDQTSPKYLRKKYEGRPFAMRWDSAEEGRQSVEMLLDSMLKDLKEDVQQIFLAFGALYVPHTTAELLSLYQKQIKGDQAASQTDLEEMLGVLVRYGLADTDPDSDVQVYTVHSLAYTYARDKQTATINRRGMAEASLAYARAHVNSFDALSREFDNLIGAAQAAQELAWDDLLIELMQLLSNQSGYFEARGYREGTGQLLEQAAERAQAQGEAGLEAAHYLFSKLGNYYSEHTNDFDKALAAYQKALAAASALEDAHRQAILLSVIGSRLIRKKDMSNARWYLDAAQRLATAHHDQKALSKIYDYRGHFEVTASNFEAAHQMFDKRREMAEQLKDDDEMFYALNNLASAENELKRPLEALAKYQRAYELGKSHANLDWRASALEGLGETYQKLGQIDEAHTHYEQALELFRKIYDQQGIARMTDVLAGLER